MERKFKFFRPKLRFGFLLTLLVILIVLSFMLYEGAKKMEKLELNRYYSFRIADELRQSSDDLTRYCRLFVWTNDVIWEKKYWNVINVRAGKEPWKNGCVISVRDSLSKLDLTPNELVKLNEAISNSNQLAAIEKHVFDVLRQDSSEVFKIKPEGAISLTKQLLFDDNYHFCKKRIMTPINDFIKQLDERIQNQVANQEKKHEYLILVILIDIICIISISFYSIVILQKKLKKEVAESKKVRGRIEHRNVELNKQKEQYRNLVENLPGAVYRCAYNKQLTIFYVSEYIETITGFPPTDFVYNRNRSYISIIHRDDVERVREEIKLGLEIEGSFVIQYRIINDNGDVKWFYERGKAIRNKSGVINYIEGVIMDITGIKRIENELMLAKKQAESANKAKSLFLSNMSHEIRTPMNAVLGHAQILNRDTSLTKDQKKSIHSINLNGEHLLQLINNFLDMSVIEVGKMKLIPTTFNLLVLMKQIEDMFKCQIEEKDNLFRLTIDEEISTLIVADENRIKQILINLVGNALKFTHKGEVNIECKKLDGNVLIKISDTGIGIPNNQLDKIFDAFEQTSNGVLNPKGTGLGLAISRNMARLMKGEITVESKINEGSNFYFTFPHKNGKKENVKKRRRDLCIEKIKGKSVVKVLIVDDHEENREMTTLLLDSIGFKTKQGASGKDAIEIAKKWKPDLILMDIVMPILNGYEAAQIIKQETSGRDIKIIAFSASVMETESEYVCRNGIDGFISKPYNETNLLECIAGFTNIEYLYKTNKAEIANFDFRREDINEISVNLLSDFREALLIGNIDRLKILLCDIEQENRRLGMYVSSLLDDFELKEIKRIFKK